LSGYRLRHAYRRQLAELETARRQIEASGRKLALFAERSPIAVLELDREGVVQDVNQAAELLFGYAADELIGDSVKRLVLASDQPEFDRQWQLLVASRQALTGSKIRNLRRDALTVVCEWTLTPLVNRQGQLLSVVAQGR